MLQLSGCPMGRQLAKDRLTNGVPSFRWDNPTDSESGSWLCLSTQVTGLSHWSLSSASFYLLEIYEFTALSGFQRRPCYQVLQKLFINHDQYVNVRCCQSAESARSLFRRFAYTVVCWGSRRFVFCGCGGAGGFAISFFAHGCVRPFGGRIRF